jgi:hypothetical protein
VSSRGRRWRDLVTIFAEQLGEERMRDEAIKTRLGVLVMLTLELERLSEEQVCDRPLDPHQLVHLAQEQRALMQELGLGSAAHLLRNKGDAPEQSDLHAYVEAQS